MKTLELKYLIPYADKGCNYSSREGTIIPFDCEDLADIHNHIRDYEADTWQDNYKLHLHPLSDLIKEIEINEKKFVPIKLLYKDGTEERVGAVITQKGIGELKYKQFLKLAEWHFDLFDLIKEGFAIDINTLKQ